MIELFFIAMVVLVFGALGYYARIWATLIAFIVMIGMLVAVRQGVEGYVLTCVAVAGIALFAGNRWAQKRAYAQFRAQDRRLQAMYDAEKNDERNR